ncbi:unnamed protein product [Adineta steineri]|uniref:PDZ domain-containing protein n=1 Tax=Adineta steineri TaxID=433720 RepID=A0A813V585_9BILA|nr:unnamed protein product [Adineta steineri]
MNENDEYSHVQRRLCAVIAKSEWTSSRMRMQKSGEELRERRAKSHRTANQFLQELLEKRTDSDLIDDNGAVDRYRKFVRYKSSFNDDTTSTLDEFHRRLRDLNNNNQQNQITKLNNQNFNPIFPKQHQSFQSDLQSTIQDRNDEEDIVRQVHNDDRPKQSRTLPSVSTIPTTSTPNDTTNELTTSTFQVDESQELSDVQSPNTSFIDSQTNPAESSIHQHHSSLFEKLETLNSSSASSTQLLTQTLYAPKARRADGSEIILSSSSSSSISQSPLPGVSSNISLYNHSYLPRSLTSRTKLNTSSTSKRQLPSLPTIQSTEQQQQQQEQQQVSHEQFNPDQLYDLLDNLDNKSNQYSMNDFTKKLEQLSLSTVIHNSEDQLNNNNNSVIENISINNDNEENILPNLFNHSFNPDQLYDLLDNLDNKSNQYSMNDFTKKLEQLSLSTVIHNSEDQLNNNNNNSSLIENISINNDNEENILPNLFNHSLLSSQEKHFYTTLKFNMDTINDIFLYTMTLSTVQLSASILLPYSILMGRRPLIKSSNETCFKEIHTKQQKNTCQVTAIESSLNTKQLQQNDILLQINDQSVWGLSTDKINDILKRSNNCSLTIARLCQPFI